MTSAVETVFGTIAAITALLVILSPTPAVYQIYKTKQIGHTNVVSLVSVLANSHVWMIHGYLTDNMFPVFATYLAGDAIALVYLFVFLRYTLDRKHAWKVIVSYVAVLLVISMYAILGGLGVFTHLSSDQVNNIMGYISVCVTLVLYSSPFLKIREVLKYKTGVFIPIHMVCAGTFNNVMWIVYTPMARIWFMLVTNSVCATLGFAQLTVYMIYHPSKHPLGYSASPEDFLAKEEEGSENEAHVSISIHRSPSASATSISKVDAAQSPTYREVHTPDPATHK